MKDSPRKSSLQSEYKRVRNKIVELTKKANKITIINTSRQITATSVKFGKTSKVLLASTPHQTLTRCH